MKEKGQGPNTGGMGACGPIHSISSIQLQNEIIAPLLQALMQEGFFYQGILYLGLMLTAQGPKILEINCRFGDPEFSVLAQILKGNWLEVFEALSRGVLIPNSLKTKGFSVSVVKAVEGYPWGKAKRISFLPPKELDYVKFFHGKTERKGPQFFAEGGRILEVTAWGETKRQARDRAYLATQQKHFHSEIYRQDIAQDWASNEF